MSLHLMKFGAPFTRLRTSSCALTMISNTLVQVQWTSQLTNVLNWKKAVEDVLQESELLPETDASSDCETFLGLLGGSASCNPCVSDQGNNATIFCIYSAAYSEHHSENVRLVMKAAKWGVQPPVLHARREYRNQNIDTKRRKSRKRMPPLRLFAESGPHQNKALVFLFFYLTYELY